MTQAKVLRCCLGSITKSICIDIRNWEHVITSITTAFHLTSVDEYCLIDKDNTKITSIQELEFYFCTDFNDNETPCVFIQFFPKDYECSNVVTCDDVIEKKYSLSSSIPFITPPPEGLENVFRFRKKTEEEPVISHPNYLPSHLISRPNE